MSTTWLWGDPHLGHANVLRHDSRPWSTIAEHDEALIAKYEERVRPKDTVIFVGDFAWRDHAQYLRRLGGRKVLIIGTHDRMGRDALGFFDRVVGARNEPGILTRSELGKLWVISHYRLASWPSRHYGSYHVYAHSHGRTPEHDNVPATDCGVPVRDWAPVNLEVLKLQLDARAVPYTGLTSEAKDTIVRLNLLEHRRFQFRYDEQKKETQT